MDTKTYKLVSGKHHKDGKTYVKGDSIELTDEELVGLANKVVDPAIFGIVTDAASLQIENEKLKARIEELELELEEIKEGLEEE